MNEKFNFTIARELYEIGGELEQHGWTFYGTLEYAKKRLSLTHPDEGFKIYKLVQLDTNQKL